MMTYYIVMKDSGVDYSPTVDFMTTDHDDALEHLQSLDGEYNYIETYTMETGV